MAYLREIDDPGIFCNSTVFSDIADSSIFESTSFRSPEMSEAKSVTSSTSLRGRKGEGIFPVLPSSHNFSALGNRERFQNYIRTELPLAYDGEDTAELAGNSMLMPPPATPTVKLRRREVNSTFLNSLLIKPKLVVITSREWVVGTVFSDAKMPRKTPFDEVKIQADRKLWTMPTGTISRLPNDMTNPQIRLWLNNIASNLAAVHNIKSPQKEGLPDRKFDSATATKGPSGSYALRKPDIIVISRADQHNTAKPKEDRVHWRNIYAFVEVTSMKSGALNHVLRQISQKAACLFDVQPQRLFVCALGIFGDISNIEYVFAVVDRAGVTYTETSSMVKQYGLLTFLRIIFAFCFASEESLGWDPTMDIDEETNELRSISVTGFERNVTIATTRKFRVIKLIHSSPILFGRGTRVWLVKDEEGLFYVLKDSWILEANSTSEIELIKHIEKTLQEDSEGYLYKHACPSYYIGQDCVHTTDKIRGIVEKPATRLQRRIVTGAIGDPITSFRSKKEFVATCLDIVNVLDFLSSKANVIHGDLSVNNILINRVWDHEPAKSPSQLRVLASMKANILSQSSYVIDVNSQLHALASAQDTNPPKLSDSPARNQIPQATYAKVDNAGTLEHIESSGMIIDCDFMRYKDQSNHQTLGTLPFMAIESLLSTPDKPFIHHAGHDLEGLLNTILTICHYTVGPGGQLRRAVVGDEDIQLNHWFTKETRLGLACSKSITLEAFDTCIKSALPQYWLDFAPFLQRLIQATWNGYPYLENPNIATHQAYRKILTDALDMYNREEDSMPAAYAFVPAAKRLAESDTQQPPQSFKRQRTDSGPSPHIMLPDRRSDTHYLESYAESADADLD